MTTYERDAWDEIGDAGNGIIGCHLKCSKGHWLLDDKEISAGSDGAKICVIMESAITGQILWRDGKIVERDIGRIADGFVPPRQLHTGWNPYTSFQAVRANREALGELVTFTSSSWGGRKAFQNLVNPYRLKQRRQFPICLLETKARGDSNGNIDPIFETISWSNRENFAELLPPPREDEQPAIAHSSNVVAMTPPRGPAELINDDIPF